MISAAIDVLIRFCVEMISTAIDVLIRFGRVLPRMLGEWAFWFFATVTTLMAQHKFLVRKYRKEAPIRLWYLPDFGFRMVARNIPGKYLLRDFKSKVRIRKILPPSKGCSVSTYLDTIVEQAEEQFVLPRQDGVLLCFRLDLAVGERFLLIVTTKDGREVQRHDVTDHTCIIGECTATVVNPYGLNFQLGRRAVASVDMLLKYTSRVLAEERERTFRMAQTKIV